MAALRLEEEHRIMTSETRTDESFLSFIFQIQCDLSAEPLNGYEFLFVLFLRNAAHVIICTEISFTCGPITR